jgi:Flp pilus assembly protein TadG
MLTSLQANARHVACRLGKCLAHAWDLALDRRGGVAPMLALTALPLLASVGAAVDYTRASAARAAMQSALDSTSLAIARAVSRHETPPDAATLFSTIFTRAEVQGVSVTSAVQSSSGGSSVTASASGVMDAMFMRVVGIPQVTLGVTTKAFTSMDTSGCVLALDGNAANAMSLGGSTSVNLSGCSVFSNSVDAAALSVGGNATLSADMIGSAGGVSISSSNVTVTDGILSHMGPVSNPYADMQVPNFGACDQNNMKVKSDTTLDPGVYCNGISVNAGASLTLNPGIYYIDGGSLSANGGGTITGTGVTIVLTSSSGKDYATANINGNASISLTAPIAGPTAGLVIFEDPKAPVGTSVSLLGGSTQRFGGAIYAPTGAISYAGGAATSASCTQIIGDTVSFSGNSGVAINCSGYNTRPFGPISIRLTY